MTVEQSSSPDSEATHQNGQLRQISVLWLLAAADQPLTLQEAAVALSAPRSSVHRLLNSLVAEGWVIAAGRPKRYHPSLKVLELGFHVARRQRARQPLVDAAIELARTVQTSVFFGFYECGEMLYTDYIDVRGERVQPRLTTARFPALLTAYGRVVLAHQPKDEIERGLTRDLSAYAKPLRFTTDELRTRLQQIRDHGYDVSDRERDPGVLGLAVPVFEAPTRVAAALGVRITGPRRQDSLDRVLEPALAAADQASADLRYVPSLFP